MSSTQSIPSMTCANRSGSRAGSGTWYCSCGGACLSSSQRFVSSNGHVEMKWEASLSCAPQSVHETDRIKRTKRVRLGCVTCRYVPPGKFFILDLLRSLLVSFWGETARVGRPTAKCSRCV